MAQSEYETSATTDSPECIGKTAAPLAMFSCTQHRGRPTGAVYHVGHRCMGLLCGPPDAFHRCDRGQRRCGIGKSRQPVRRRQRWVPCKYLEKAGHLWRCASGQPSFCPRAGAGHGRFEKARYAGGGDENCLEPHRRLRMNLSNIGAVIFDMDGLLVDSERLAHLALIQTASAFGTIPNPKVFTRMIGLPEDGSID